MLNMKNKLAKRIMAFVLSGAMVISGLAPTGMTAYAAEASDDTGSGYSREVTRPWRMKCHRVRRTMKRRLSTRPFKW